MVVMSATQEQARCRHACIADAKQVTIEIGIRSTVGLGDGTKLEVRESPSSDVLVVQIPNEYVPRARVAHDGPFGHRVGIEAVVAIDVVLGEVEYRADIGAKTSNVFQHEARQLQDDAVTLAEVVVHGGDRDADVTGQDDRSGDGQNVCEEARRRGFAIGSGNGGDALLARTVFEAMPPMNYAARQSYENRTIKNVTDKPKS